MLLYLVVSREISVRAIYLDSIFLWRDKIVHCSFKILQGLHNKNKILLLVLGNSLLNLESRPSVINTVAIKPFCISLYWLDNRKWKILLKMWFKYMVFFKPTQLVKHHHIMERLLFLFMVRANASIADLILDWGA